VRNDLLPLLGLVDRAPQELVMPARNVRAVDPAHLRETAASISTLGFTVPVLIDGGNVVLDGAVRIEAAKLLGLPKVPCIVVSHLTTAERRLLRIALNRQQEKGEWDFEALKLELQELIIEDAPVEVSGFSLPEIDQILLDDDVLAPEAGPLAPEPKAVPIAQVGDHFILGEHELVCGDATDPHVLASLMGTNQARLVLTDEPYNVKISGHVTGGDHREFLMASGEMTEIEFRNFNDAWMGSCMPYLLDGGLFATFIDWRGYPVVHAAATQRGLAAMNLVVWTKTNAGMGSLYRSQHELLPLFKKGKASHVNNVELGRHGRWRSNHWTYPGASSMGSDARRGLQDHPTVKPVAMLEDALLDLTNRDDIVLDPFMGSGSTLIAAVKTGRRCRGLELDPLYVDVIVRRYEEVTGTIARLLETRETFAELSERRKRPSGS
jgi:DNA modification methylase